ncbi:MAG: 2-C-methyl-D-erythritol 4-phosphate cytidylyltransferase [Granulosicoccus sp.]|nr:2-C-methyl-D-erythritol 4-phosphate cytidylyltransferase [Granulosicoccus sp.]
MMEPLWMVVPAAGSGSRLGADVPKQYAMLSGQSMLQHTLSRLVQVPDVAGIVVCLAVNDAHWPEVDAANHPLIHATPGGQTRAASVAAGLRFILDRSAEDTWVLVHDAARPLVSLTDIKRLTDAVYNSGAIGGILATRVQDTLKRADTACYVQGTVSRRDLWQAQTPQLFRAGELFAALQSISNSGVVAEEITDESSVMERSGYEPLLVESLQPNLKVTRPTDLLLARVLLQHYPSPT